jgi:outer membrane receptor protein involved in Fe transport
MDMKRATGWACSAAVVLPWFLASAASAQTAPAPAPEAATTADIVVTAQKREERLIKVPISVSVLSGVQLDQQTGGGVTDALRTVAGVSITSTPQGGATQLTIRGVAAGGATLSGSSTAAFYVDSVPFGLVKSAILPDTDSYDMERIEVLRGPQGTLYGANALNGVVRLLTNDANLTRFQAKARAGVSTTKGGDVSYRGDAAINIPLIQDRLALRVVGGYDHAGGWIDQPNRGVSNANVQLSRYVRAKLNARPTDELTIGLSAWISRVKQDAPNYSDDNDVQTSPVPLPQTLNFDAYSGKLGYDFGSVSFSSATSYLKFTNDSQRDYTSFGAGQRLFTHIQSRVFTEEVLLNSAGSGSFRWSLGGFYRDATDLLYQTLFLLPAPIDTNDKSRSFAVFGQATQSFADGTVELTGGLRYFSDRVSTVERTPSTGVPTQVLANRTATFHALTPRVVLTYLPSRTFTAYASYSQGFRSGFNQSPSVIRTAPDLPPVEADKLHNFEVGTKGNVLGGTLTFDAALYYIKWKGIQSNLTLRYLGVPIAATVNGPSASGIGFDLAMTAHPTHGFEVGTTFSYSGLKLDEQVISNLIVLFDKGDRLSYSPKFTVGIFSDYNFPIGGSGLEGRIEGSFNYRSKVPARALVSGVSRLYLSDDSTIGRAAFSVKSPANWTATLFVDNVTNYKGLLQPPTDVSQMLRIRPRTVGLQVEFHL